MVPKRAREDTALRERLEYELGVITSMGFGILHVDRLGLH